MLNVEVTWPTGLKEVWISPEETLEQFVATHWGSVDPAEHGVTLRDISFSANNPEGAADLPGADQAAALEVPETQSEGEADHGN